jgi:hypothetical protein
VSGVFRFVGGSALAVFLPLKPDRINRLFRRCRNGGGLETGNSGVGIGIATLLSMLEHACVVARRR